MRRRWICVVLLVSVLLSMGIPARADAYEDLRQKMLESFLSEDMLDISQYGLTLMEVQEVYDELYHSGQLPWYADEDCSYVFGENQTIAKFRPKVLSPKVYDRDLYEQKLAELIAAACLPGMSDWQKVLSVHDYIVQHTVYDEELEKNTGYDSLIGGTTVCYGYSMLYMDVMNRLGIPCQIVITDGTERYGHAWNVVQLDGQWYHVDLTWADPTPDVYGYASHEYFLKTDAEYEEGPAAHDYTWISLVTVAESTYDRDAFLDEVNSAICFLDANTAIFRREDERDYSVVSRDLTTGEETVLYEFGRKELNLGQGWYLYPTYGLSVWNGRVYFNREDEVLSMLPDGSDLQTVYTYEVEDRYVVGSMVDNGVLYLSLTDHDGQIERMEVPLEDVQFHTHSYEEQGIPATCQQDGYSQMVCQCGITYNYTVIPQTEHEMTTTVEKAPTELEAGVTCHSCTLCDYKTYEYPPALPKPEPEVVEVPEEPEARALWIPVTAAIVLLLAVVIAVFLLATRKKRKYVPRY